MKNIIIAGLMLFASSTAYSGLYRWVDDSGEVHFSDKVPAKSIQKGHSELDKNGVTRKIINHQKALEKQEEQDLILDKEKQEKRLKKIKFLKMQEIRKKDRSLLSTYDTEKELIRYFDRKMKQIIGNSNILKAQNTKLINRVAKLEKTRSATANKVMGKSLDKKIVDLNLTIKQYEQALMDNDLQLIQVSRNYKTDHQRYIELTK